MLNSYIYEITNTITQEQYIGIRRCEGDIYTDKYKGEDTIISKDFRRYGKKNFVKRVLAVIIDDKMEQDLLDLYMNHSGYKLISECSKEELATKRSTVGAKNGSSRKVICLNTGRTFETITEAADRYNIDISGIIHACNPNHKQVVAGKDENGNYLRWMYYDAYIAEANGEEYDYSANKMGPKTGKTKSVKCIQTNETFDSLQEAAEKYNTSPGSISNSCSQFNSAGKHPDTGQKLYWEYIKKQR